MVGVAIAKEKAMIKDGLEPVWQCGLGSLHIGTDLCHSLFAILCGCKIRKQTWCSDAFESFS